MSLEQINNNKVFVAGKIHSEPIFSHKVMDENFYECFIKINRLSGSSDILPVTISENLMNEHNFRKGSFVACSGQFRSYNKPDGEKSKLVLTVFVKEVEKYNSKVNPNVIELNGFICKDPVYRVTPFKREICDVLVAVNRGYNKSDFLPCIAWGKNARFVNDCKVGDNIKLTGRIQSRIYQKKISETEVVERVAYEISLSKVTNKTTSAMPVVMPKNATNIDEYVSGSGY